ncbi:hypothetical protein D3C83_185380 [compost metagenome]
MPGACSGLDMIPEMLAISTTEPASERRRNGSAASTPRTAPSMSASNMPRQPGSPPVVGPMETLET